MIYLLEDEKNIRDLIVYTFNNTGLNARGFERASEFWSCVETEKPDLVLLDIMLPDEDGISVLKKLRKRNDMEKVPVIMLTAKTTEYDKVVGLETGADDYVSKPFGMMELVARVKAHLRRSQKPEEKKTSEEEFYLGDLYVNTLKHRVTVAGKDVILTFKEFELLCYLLRNKDIVLTRDKILCEIWGYSFDGETRTVDVHIRTLRQKLGTMGKSIQTVRGVGYRISKDE